MSEALILAVKDYVPDRHGDLAADVAARMHQIGAEFDATELSGRRMTIYCYGPSAEAMYSAIEPLVESWQLAAGSTATLRFGEPGRHPQSELCRSGARTGVPAANQPVGLRPRSGTRSAIGLLSRSLVMGTSSAGLTCVHSLMMIGYYFGPLRADVRVSMR